MTGEEKDRLDIAYELGLYYGYPKCCIQEFVSDLLAKKEPRFRNIPGNQTGFIPCMEHTQQIIKGKISLESLIDGRVCRHSFPKRHELD